MPIQLKLRDDLEEAVASYKHYDVLVVNAMFDGMNLVAKEGPLVNERSGVSVLSENTGRPRGARRVRAQRQPVRHPGDGDSLHAALTMDASERRRRHEGLRGSSPRATRATGSTSSWPTSARRAGSSRPA
jgi:trehalose 6-phosphate synthase